MVCRTTTTMKAHELPSETVVRFQHRTWSEAFGNITDDSSASIGALFRFTARAFDEDGELQNNLNRWYDLSTGRWMSVDPIGFEADDMNLYRYVGNGVTVSVDPTGAIHWDTNWPPRTTLEPRCQSPRQRPTVGRGDLLVTVYVRQPRSGHRDTFRKGLTDYGHAFVRVAGYDDSGTFREQTRGFYPTQPWEAVNEQPQRGRVNNDAGSPHNVKYEFLVRDSRGRGGPTLEEMFDFKEQYDDNSATQPYDFDDRNCTDFVLDVMAKAGHPSQGPRFGRLRFERDGNTKWVPTPSELGEDLREIMDPPVAVIEP